jgi:hypothetical protein
MQIPLLTCPRCLRVIINPNAATRPAVEPRQVVPLEEEVHYDLRDTVGGLTILALTLFLGAVVAWVYSQMAGLGAALFIGAMMTVAGGIWAARRPKDDQQWEGFLPPPPLRDGRVLEYQQVRPKVSVLAFIGGFLVAITIGIICFYAMVATGDRASVGTRRLVFAGMLVLILGMVYAATRLGRIPGWAGFGRGVAVGLAMSMMALGPCGACYMLTLFG